MRLRAFSYGILRGVKTNPVKNLFGGKEKTEIYDYHLQIIDTLR